MTSSRSTWLLALTGLAMTTITEPALSQQVKPAGNAEAASSNDQAMPPDMQMGDQQKDGSSAPPMNMPGMDMSGGKPGADARDPDAYSDGYRNSTLPGYEMADKISVAKVLVDELEFLTNKQGQGISWSGQIINGPDNDKLLLRSQGLKQSGERLDPESSVEAFWWHGQRPFWGTILGVRQDIGPGAHRWIAGGIEGLAPYWFDVQLTGYVGDDGRLAARLKASYDVLLTNRLILVPQLESNAYSKAAPERGLGGGLSNLELGLRMRYEIHRKVAPYVGFVWERSFGETADFRRLAGENPTEHRFVAGLRIWW
ncbi:copper resistance protein B [Sphingobium sp. BS19]|nr:copper resistance protein B [Sphingobium sp. BS19]